jgi:undecaprenyl-diphosphatase
VRVKDKKEPVRRLLTLARRIGRNESTALLLLFLVVGLTWAFVAIADEVVEGETRSFDRWLILALRNPRDANDPLGGRWLEELFRDITALGSNGVLALIFLSVIGYLLLYRKLRTAALMTVSIAGGTLLSYGFKMMVDRPRPDLISHDFFVSTASFPSGHATMAAVTYLTLGALLARIHPEPRVKAYFLLLSMVITLIVGLSRVYMGVHWPTDVLGGWTLGTAWALLCWLVAHWLQQRGRMEPEGQVPARE